MVRRTRRRTLLRHLIGLSAAAVFLLPLYWAVVASLGPPGAPPAGQIVWWPSRPAWENYPALFAIVPMGRYLANSFLVVLVAVPLTWLTASWAGFAMVQLGHRQQRRLASWSAVLLLVPPAAVWLIRFQIYSRLGLLDTLWALIAPAFAGGNPLYVLLFYWTYRQVPGEMIEAARIDGASWLLVWRRIASPLARPTGAAVVILAFVKYWSDFTDPILYIFDTQKYTLPIGLQLIKQLDVTKTPYLMAASVLMILPVLLLFLLAQRVFLGDLSLARLLERD